MKQQDPVLTRLMMGTLECRDSLRNLATRIETAGNDPAQMAAVLEVAHRTCLSLAGMLQGALKSSNARRHKLVAPDPPVWSIARAGEGKNDGR